MGNNNSSRKNDVRDDDDDFCVLFCPPSTQAAARQRRRNRRRKKNRDLLGTPLPGTPLHVKRKMFEEAVMSSRYPGLEKEVPSTSTTRDDNSEDDEDYFLRAPLAQIYEGKDAEMKMNRKYDLLEAVGVGSTSTVHRCVDRHTSTVYACKVIDKEYISERFNGMMDQFHTEIDALRSLSHPHIIQLYDVFISEHRIYIIMELMEGGELFDFVVERQALTEEEASTIVRKVTSALVYMHSNNVIHRDLKPENLLLKHKPRSTLDLEVKIIDFGLSKTLEGDYAQSFLGTRGYLAPEMLQRIKYSKAIDVWALGVIVFVLLCGCLPFDDDSQPLHNPALLKQRFVLRYPKWAKNLSNSAKDLLSHLLDIDPHSRYTAEQALRHPWVRGTTADRKIQLESPGRMTPRSMRSKRGSPGTPQINKQTTPPRHTGTTTYQNLIAPPASATARQNDLVRKVSI